MKNLPELHKETGRTYYLGVSVDTGYKVEIFCFVVAYRRHGVMQYQQVERIINPVIAHQKPSERYIKQLKEFYDDATILIETI